MIIDWNATVLALTTVLMASVVAAEPPSFRVVSATQADLTGQVERIDGDWSVALSGSKSIPGGELISMRRVTAVSPPWPREAQLAFSNGDQLAGEAISC